VETVFIRAYSLLKIERLIADLKLTLPKALIMSVMIYACPTWEFATDMQLLKLQLLQNKVLGIIRKFPNCTAVRELHMAFQVQAISRGHKKS
jgi:hypothetical protein